MVYELKAVCATCDATASDVESIEEVFGWRKFGLAGKRAPETHCIACRDEKRPNRKRSYQLLAQCDNCGRKATDMEAVVRDFGWKKLGVPQKQTPQSYCKACRSEEGEEPATSSRNSRRRTGPVDSRD